MNDSESVVVAPSWDLVLWTAVSAAFLIVAITCFVICMLKGRWGSALLGLFTFGIFAMIGSALGAMPGSVWAKRKARRSSFEQTTA